jgi:hypothetical protein
MVDAPLTITVPEAGRKYLGLSRNGSYAAADRGEIPVIQIGRLKRVPIRAMEALLDRASEPQSDSRFHQPIRPAPGERKPGRTDMRARQKEFTLARYRTAGASSQ